MHARKESKSHPHLWSCSWKTRTTELIEGDRALCHFSIAAEDRQCNTFLVIDSLRCSDIDQNHHTDSHCRWKFHLVSWRLHRALEKFRFEIDIFNFTMFSLSLHAHSRVSHFSEPKALNSRFHREMSQSRVYKCHWYCQSWLSRTEACDGETSWCWNRHADEFWPFRWRYYEMLSPSSRRQSRGWWVANMLATWCPHIKW